MQIRTINKNWVIVALIAMTTVGCSKAKLAVYHVPTDSVNTNNTTLPSKGVYYVLPRTQIDVVTTVKKYVFTAGEFEKYVTHSDLQGLDLVSKRLTNEGGLFPGKQCVKNEIGDLTSKTQTRYERRLIDIQTSSKQDPNQIYFVELDAGYFEDLEFETEFTLKGTPVSQSHEIVNRSEDIILSLAQTGLSAFTRKSYNFGSSVLSFESLDISDKGTTSSPTTKELPKAVKKLASDIRSIRATRFEIVTGTKGSAYPNGSNLDQVLEQLKTTEEELTKKLVGEIKTMEFKQKFSHKPEDLYATDPLTTAPSDSTTATATSPDPATVSAASLDPSTGKQIADFKLFTFDRCNAATAYDKNAANQKEENLYTLRMQLTEESNSVMKAIKETSTQSALSSEELGLRYRIPSLATVSLINNNQPKATATKPIAQFGLVRALPAGVGRKSTIDIEYYEDLGSLKKLTAKSEGRSTEPTTNAIKEVFENKDELTELQREYEILKLEKDIEDLKNKSD